MSTKKRQLEASTSSKKTKRAKLDPGDKKKTKTVRDTPQQHTSTLLSEDVDFPRGGGTTFTPVEVKVIRAEAVKEANEELFKDAAKKSSAKRRKSDAKGKSKVSETEKQESIRVEHLNYKRVVPGMKILAQIVIIQPLALIVSLPNQLLGHVPITQISSELTEALERMDEDADASDADADDSAEEDNAETSTKSRVPDLFEIFQVGQYVRCVVTATHTPGSTDNGGLGVKGRGEVEKRSRRVELSLVPSLVNANVLKSDLKPGFTTSAAVKSVEDHGYILDLGITDVSGFLSFDDAKSGPWNAASRLHIGRVVDTCVVKMSKNGRTCTLSVDPRSMSTASITEITNVTSVLPGNLVQCLVTAVVPSGLNLQVLGYFEGTVDLFHLPPGDLEESFKVGKKLKARILYDIQATSPPRFALSLSEHILALKMKDIGANDASSGTLSLLQEAYPIGTVLDSVKVLRVDTEKGLVVEVSPTATGYIHISQVSDDHVATLAASSGPWRVSTVHRARVTGYHAFDGILQLSLKPSILEQKFVQVSDVQVGEVIKGTIKKLTDSALFVEISGNVDGVVWPNHYADIVLKHPQKRFKPGGSIKCRVLVVNPDRNRISLTAKKTLVDSDLPIIAGLQDAKVGCVTHAVVFRVLEKSLQVEFFNNLKALVSGKETSNTTIGDLATAFPVGKTVKVRIISVEPDSGRIVASIRQATTSQQGPVAVEAAEIGDVVSGTITEVHKDNVLLSLQPSQVKALLSLNNLANHQGQSASHLRVSLKQGQKLDGLIVVTRNAEKGIVIVANRPKAKASSMMQGAALTMDSVQPGSVVGGRVLRHTRKGALVKLNARITGVLHPTDCCDNYEEGTPFPGADTVLKTVVLEVDKERNQLVLSMRRSRTSPSDNATITDPEINDVQDLKKGQPIRGFIKSVTEHGIYVMLGRGVDARVQIREMFDDYVKDWKSRFEANQLVKGRILSIDYDKKQVEMSFRSGDLSRNTQSALTLADLSEGQKVEGRVRKVEEYGLFIEIAGSKLSGLCHKSQISDNQDADVTLALRSFREGDSVKALILSIDHEKRRISLGLKPSYFSEEDLVSSEEEEDEQQPAYGVVDEDEDGDAQPSDDGEPGESSIDEDSGPEEDEDGGHPMEVDVGDITSLSLRGASAPTASSSGPGLKLHGGFQWSADTQVSQLESPSDSSDEGEDEVQSGKKKRRKRKEIEQDFTADMHTKTPESNADFERLLLGSPDSSYLWVQYMSFLLQLSEVDKAREVGRRALRTINFREEQEKLNVWIALLNLENAYGTDDTLDDVFKEAARSNDSKTVHLRLASILDQSEKYEKAEEQFKKTAKKFGQSSKVWTLFGEYYLRRGDMEQARKLLPRSLQSLEKRKHLKTISKFAQLEYKLGDPERGKTVFEGIVDSHPKRWDLWSVYMDMEATQKNMQSLRNLFDRVLSLKMTSHKAKSFFKKWLELERSIGDDEGADAVKAKAVEWTQRAAKGTEED